MMRQSGPVLIVSTNADTQDLYIRGLRDRRTNVFAASDCEEVFLLCRGIRIGVVVFDVMTSDDWTCCGRIRECREMRSVPIVVLTGWIAPNGRYRQMARELGCAAFIAKPCPLELVLATIDRVRAGQTGIEVVASA